jgi:hypothetical protein
MTKLTGKKRVRSNWRKQLILQVEVASEIDPSYGNGGLPMQTHWWRDARVEDFVDPVFGPTT